MKHRIPVFMLLFVSAVLFAACAKAPEQALTTSRDALTAARDAGADQYVPELYVAAADSFAAAEAEIETQNARNAFSRDYDRAEALLAFVTESAQVAQTRVSDQKEIVRTENEALFATVDSTLARVADLMTQAPVGKDGNVALASIREDATLAGSSLAAARAAQEAGDSIRANAIAEAALEKGQALAAELVRAIEATGRSPRS
jgi:hypothetical protein